LYIKEIFEKSYANVIRSGKRQKSAPKNALWSYSLLPITLFGEQLFIEGKQQLKSRFFSIIGRFWGIYTP